MNITRNRWFVYCLILFVAVSWVFTGYIYSENRRLSAELAEKIIPEVTDRIVKALKEDMRYE